MKAFWSWLITSSVDPEKVGLTAKAFLVGIIPMLTFLFATVCSSTGLCIDTSALPQFMDLLGTLLVNVLWIVATTLGLVGIIRKVYFGRWAAPQK